MSLDVYPPVNSPEWWFEVSQGNITGVSVVHKFGRNIDVGTSFEPVTMGGLYQTPQPAAATTLRVKVGDVADTAAGAGAREVTLFGLDETGAEVTAVLATAGTSASSATSETFIRLYRAFVSASGTYGTTGAGSHVADIVIENGAGGTNWLTIDSTDFSRGQSEIAAYSVPLGKTAYVTYIHMSVSSKESADIFMCSREGILDAAAPYSAVRLQIQSTAVAGEAVIKPNTPLGPYPASTDILFLAKGTAAAEVDVDFEIILVDT